MTHVALIEVPYDLGREHVGLGRGVPVLAETLRDERTEPIVVERGEEFTNEVGASMRVVKALAETTRAAVSRGDLPFVLAGNCHSALGTVAGIGAAGLGVVWLDAHGDFNTPETSTTGFFDGMGLAMLTGSGWARMRASVPGLEPVPEESVVLVGARAIDEPEEERFRASSVTRSDVEGLPAALDRLRDRVESVYLHIDLDVLDPSIGRANWFAEEGGLTVEELEAVIDEVGKRFAIRAAALTAYQPECDPEGRIPPAARAIFDCILAVAGSAQVTR